MNNLKNEILAEDLAKILLQHPKAKVKISIEETDPPICYVKDFTDNHIDFEDVRNEAIFYITINKDEI